MGRRWGGDRKTFILACLLAVLGVAGEGSRGGAHIAATDERDERWMGD